MTEREFIVLVAIIVFIVLFASSSSSGGSSPTPDPDENKQKEIAREILRGNASPEEIAGNDGYDIEHINQWVEIYEKAAIKAALEAEKTSNRIELMEDDIEWFKETCRKFIGDDWEAKTDFPNRFITKHMK